MSDETTAQHNAQGMANREPIPPHPLVVDAVTGLCRYVTQEDIHKMEAMIKAFDTIVAHARMAVECADRVRGLRP